MLATYFKHPHTLQQLRSGPAGPYLDGFADLLHAEGFSWWTARRHLAGAAHLGVWTNTVNIEFVDLNEMALSAFAKHLSCCTCKRPNANKGPSVIAGAKHFRNYLKSLGVVPLEKDEGLQPIKNKPLFEGFRRWMRDHRGVTERTLEIYGPTVIDVLDTLGDDPSGYNVEKLRYFVFDRLRRSSRSEAKTTVKALRMFLRFLIAQGLCSSGLEEASPRLADWRLSSLPRYLPSDDVERIIGACDTTTRIGCRDRAIILLLARLGLRGGDIAALRLQDIDWADGSIRVSGKGRRQVRLPLPQEVGDAILEYLKRGRLPVNDDHVFMKGVAPLGPLGSGSRVSTLVARAIQRAGIDAPSHGAHVLRHSAATAMLRQGISLNGIAAILRHRSVETTVHYAKVDLALLKEVAQPWPEVNPC